MGTVCMNTRYYFYASSMEDSGEGRRRGAGLSGSFWMTTHCSYGFCIFGAAINPDEQENNQRGHNRRSSDRD